nr:MAG TPA: hypothetical protein [Caudoviricetes sp.]
MYFNPSDEPCGSTAKRAVKQRVKETEKIQ